MLICQTTEQDGGRHCGRYRYKVRLLIKPGEDRRYSDEDEGQDKAQADIYPEERAYLSVRYGLSLYDGLGESVAAQVLQEEAEDYDHRDEAEVVWGEEPCQHHGAGYLYAETECLKE